MHLELWQDALATTLALAFTNFLWESGHDRPDFWSAFEHSYFQASAVLAMWLAVARF